MGQDIRYCIAESPPWIILGESTSKPLETHGAAKKFVNSLVKRLNATQLIKDVLATEQYLDIGKITGLNKGTGMMGFFARNECDIALNPSQLSPELLDYVDFSVPVWMFQFKIISNQPLYNTTNSFALINIFPLDIWISSMLALVIVAIMLLLMEYTLSNKSSWYSYASIQIEVFGMLVNRGLNLGNKSKRIKIFEYTSGLLWIIAFYLLNLFFSVKLLSSLTLPDTAKYFDCLEDLLSAPSIIIRVSVEHSIRFYLEGSNDDVKEKIWKQVIRTKGLFDVAQCDPIEEIDNALSGKTVLLADKDTIFLSFACTGMCGTSNLHVHVSKELFLVQPYFLVMRKGFNDPTVINTWQKFTERYMASGIIYADVRNEFLETPACVAMMEQPEETPHVISITLKNLYLPLETFLSGVILSVVTLVLELNIK